MNKNIFIALLSAIYLNVSAQTEYAFHSQKGDKYFVSLGYGYGTAQWSSVFKNTEFYDKDGAVIKSGDFNFKGDSPIKYYDVNVMAPVKHVRLGLGIAFEYHYLAELKIYSQGGDAYLMFNEGMRFDKVYLQIEKPFKYDSKKKYSLSMNVKLGMFGYTNMNRFNFLGEKPYPFTCLVATGLVLDYEIYPHVYAFAIPNIEYKFYSNTHTDTPVQVIHHVFAESIQGGIRVDLGMFYN